MAALRRGLLRAAPRLPRSSPGSNAIGKARRPRPRRPRAERSGGAAGRSDFGEPGASLALCLGDLARRHFFSDVSPAFLGKHASVERREIEPFVRLDQVDAYAAAAGGIGDSE